MSLANYNLPLGGTMEPPDLGPCRHVHDDGADAWTEIHFESNPNDDGIDRMTFRCGICGEQQERECRP